ncbi:hypothetical protein [Hymenobacter sp. HDW8]|uniref:hypothetical protein n=1 Tax=Hymenobacter sp. HDW8 TaxID=2714932 RepID=UPI00140A6BD8|nr:hypothetical protein [Hymenobacter sp. HDW8]QIL78352.1 hypothetical protein G7064_21290 [Hymenobacter sp. HDW8]
MRGKRVHFFAEEQDLRQLISAFEALAPGCQYFETGSFASSTIPTYHSLLDVPNLGTVHHGDWIHARGVLVLPSDIPLVIRPVDQLAGGVRYMIDQLANPYGFVLKLGGIFQPGVLVASGASTLATDDASLALFGSLARRVKKQTRVDTFYVGHQAYSHLQAGWRLVLNVRSPIEYDLPKQ